MIHRFHQLWCVLFLLAMIGGVNAGVAQGAPARTQPVMFDSMLTKNDLDSQQCYFIRASTKQKELLDLDTLRRIMHIPIGAGGSPIVGARMSPDQAADTFHYVISFSAPVAPGAIVYHGTSQVISVLKPDAPYPADPLNDAQWQPLDIPPGQQPYRVIPVPVGTRFRAIRLTDQYTPSKTATRGVSSLNDLRLIKTRFGNVTPLAVTYAESEYTTISSGGGPSFTFAASLLATGGPWQNSGVNERGRFLRAPISDVDPCWVIMSWEKKQTLSAIWLNSNIIKAEVDVYDGPDSLNPRAGTGREWKPIENLRVGADPGAASGLFIEFDPVQTRGIRIRILQVNELIHASVAHVDGVSVLTDLKSDALPSAGVAEVPKPPVSWPFSLASEGTVTMVINDEQGHRIRNLCAREMMPKGDNAGYWDLRDEQGITVPLGKYEWKAITLPGGSLGLKYEMSPYPNVKENTADNAPWITRMEGPDGWLADHTPPRASATFGDRMFIGAPVSESGVSLIATDLTGKRLWAHASFAGFTGAWWLAADSKNVYVGANAGNTASAWQVDPSTEPIWAVDTTTQQVREVARLQPSGIRKRGIQSMVADDGKIYISVHANENWFAGAAVSSDVNIESCVPNYKARAKEKFAYQIIPDPRNDFMRLFRLTGSPPGGGSSGPGELIYLESTAGKGARQYIVLTFSRPIPLGSVVFPVPRDPNTQIKLSVLKPDGAYPPNPGKQGDWIPFATDAKASWDVATAPPDTLTRALRITFIRGVDDIFTQSDDANAPTVDKGDLNAKKGMDDEDSKDFWKGQLEGMTLLARRYENVAPKAKVRVNSGRVDSDGVWNAARKDPITEAKPGIYVLEWEEKQNLRGLAIREIDGKRTLIDVYTGDAPGPVDINGDMNGSGGWKQVGEYQQVRRMHHSGFPSYNGDARYVDGTVDFGKEISTRAVRLRVVDQWSDNGRDVDGIRRDLGGITLDPTRCRIFGVAAMKYLGGEKANDPLTYNRVEMLDVASGKIAKETPVPEAGPVAMTPAKDVLVVSGMTVVKLDFAKGQHQTLISDLIQPQAMAVDSKANIYVYDQTPERRNIRVYDPSGKFLREIGKTGGYQVGPWDPYRFNDISSLSIDSTDQLWAVDWTYYPKRVSIWKTDGTFIKDLLGNTRYGGGGVLDPWDKSRLFYGPLEFELNWATGHTRLKNYLWLGDTPAGETPIRIGERTYLVTRPGQVHDSSASQTYAVVYLYEKDHMRRVAAMGQASGFAPLSQAEIRAGLGFQNLTESEFIWNDLNGDGQVQALEVTLIPKSQVPSQLTGFNRDLGVQAGSVRFEVKEFMPDGRPVYVMKKMPGLPEGYVYRLENGNFYCMGDGGSPERVVDPAGKTVWTYPTLGMGVQAIAKAQVFRNDQLVCQFATVGHEKFPGDLGEFVVNTGNLGIWNIWTADGLLAGNIFRDLRDPKARSWSMKEHDRGMSLDNLTVGQEHFQGSVTMTQSDGKVYAVAGHNHISVVEVLGMDTFKRMSGTIDVTLDKLKATQAWEQVAQKQAVFTRAPVVDCYRVRTPPVIDGKADDWEFSSASLEGAASLSMCYDDRALYVCYQINGFGPFKNTGTQWDRMFKTGAGVDLQIATDPDAATDRQAPVKGDKRILMTVMEGKPTAILYDAVVPGTPPEKTWEAASPVAKVTFDHVAQVPEVRMATSETSRGGYIVEAAIPWSVLGIKPVPNLRLKMDWGFLVTDQEGNAVLRRIYWANKATGIIADVPSEARLTPGLWGHVIFHNRGPLSQPEVGGQKIDLGKGGAAGGSVDKFMNELDENK